MSFEYSEGPFQNFKWIHFQSDRFFVFSRFDSANLNIVTIHQTGPEGEPEIYTRDPQRLQGVITGKVSGASVDFSKVGVHANIGSAVDNVPEPTACVWTSNFAYDLETGALYDSMPAVVGAIYDGRTEPEVNIALLYSRSSTTLGGTEVDPICSGDGNAPALPGFIIGEDCTITYPTLTE